MSFGSPIEPLFLDLSFLSLGRPLLLPDIATGLAVILWEYGGVVFRNCLGNPFCSLSGEISSNRLWCRLLFGSTSNEVLLVSFNGVVFMWLPWWIPGVEMPSNLKFLLKLTWYFWVLSGVLNNLWWRTDEESQLPISRWGLLIDAPNLGGVLRAAGLTVTLLFVWETREESAGREINKLLDFGSCAKGRSALSWISTSSPEVLRISGDNFPVLSCSCWIFGSNLMDWTCLKKV